MGDKINMLVMCRFPEWGYEGQTKKYAAFGVKYLVQLSIDDIEHVEKTFIEKYEQKIGKKFEGEILFIEEFYCCIL